MKPIKLIISGGGTGGHIYPALAIAMELKQLNNKSNILFVGAKGKLEMEKVPKEGFKIIGLWISGFKILDVQFLNDHLIQFGAYEINKTKFKQDLNKAIQLKTDFYCLPSTDDDFFNCLSTFLQARIETS